MRGEAADRGQLGLALHVCCCLVSASCADLLLTLPFHLLWDRSRAIST